jgi:hypothetical protein
LKLGGLIRNRIAGRAIEPNASCIDQADFAIFAPKRLDHRLQGLAFNLPHVFGKGCGDLDDGIDAPDGLNPRLWRA